ncbi:hypothetical protein [Natrinema salsiterrestre]|uniref:Uncharacterized protein n=1 Tax=Natrinema salsiterrestre TaxID=2950540 RepID=A0A9Q4L123_9EURY|nr:hypothetical protein [Natrinema salsiterrestre]MDF9746166.1 hypothetical protein [Natrinema salsiterrestre]
MTLLSIILIGMLWTFEMSVLLTETQAVQTILNTFLSGIILLVSIVVSINSTVLSYDITHISAQQERIKGMREFRRELDRVTVTDEDPTNARMFIQVVAETIRDHAHQLEDVAEGSDEELATDIREYTESITETADHLDESIHHVGGAEFGVLWLGLETDYGPMMDQVREFAFRFEDDESDVGEDPFEDLLQALELFATGREYFKTLYYSREISELSRTLLISAFPSIIATVSTILAINANLVPEIWMLGLPPLLMFVAIAFSIALIPFLVLTSFTIRMATVARRTAGAGPFILQ